MIQRFVIFLFFLSASFSLATDVHYWDANNVGGDVQTYVVSGTTNLPNGVYYFHIKVQYSGGGDIGFNLGFNVNNGAAYTSVLVGTAGPPNPGSGTGGTYVYSLDPTYVLGHPDVPVSITNAPVVNIIHDGSNNAPYTQSHTTYSFVIGASPAKHPQPLQLHADGSKDTKDQVLMIIDPNAHVVMNFGVGAGQTASSEYQPPDNPVVGAYSLCIATTPGAMQQGVPGPVQAIATLSATPNDPTYSHKWNVDTLSATLTGGGGNPPGSNGRVTNNGNTPAILQWKDASGNPVGGAITVPAGGSYDPSILDLGTTLPAGLSGQMTLTANGQQIGTATLSRSSDGGGASLVGNVTATLNPVIASGTPTPNQTNGGNVSSGNQTGNSSTTIVNNPSTTIGGGSGGATNQDIYNDVKQALTDAGKEQASNASAPSLAPLKLDDLALDRGHLDELQGKADSIEQKLESVRTGGTDKINSFFSGRALPTNLGTVTHYDFGTYQIAGQTLSLDIDFTPFLSGLNFLKICMVILLTWLTLYAVIRLTRSYI